MGHGEAGLGYGGHGKAGVGKGRGSMEEYVEVLQYTMYIFNSIFFCAGAGIFAVGLWIRFDKDMDEYIQGLGMNFYWAGTSIIMAGAALVMLSSFMACCGAFFKNTCMILAYKAMTIVTFIMMLGGSAYVLDHGLESSKIYPWLQEAIRNQIYRYQIDTSARRSVDIVQEYIGCCGGYGSGDYDAIHLPHPDTCRDQVTGNEYGDSCAEVFSWFLEVRSGWISGLSISLCFLQCFAMIFAFCMYKGLKEMRK